MLGVNAQAWQSRLHVGIASGLDQAGWSQTKIANTLGTTQSTVCRWFARPTTNLATRTDEVAIDAAARSIVEKLCRDGLLTGGLRISVEGEGISGEDWRASFTVSTSPNDDAAERDNLLSEMVAIVSDLPQLPTSLKPAVGVNIAACTENCSGASDVVAFQGRLRLDSGTLHSDQPPSFGASGHLCEVLLALRTLGGTASAIANFRPPSQLAVQGFTERHGFSCTTAPKGIPEAVADILLDEGDFGWEPSLYVTGRGLHDLSKRLHALFGAFGE